MPGRLGAQPASAVVVMSHDYLRDAAFLGAFAGRGVAYLGVLGPRERTERLLDELGGLGHPAVRGRSRRPACPRRPRPGRGRSTGGGAGDRGRDHGRTARRGRRVAPRPRGPDSPPDVAHLRPSAGRRSHPSAAPSSGRRARARPMRSRRAAPRRSRRRARSARRSWPAVAKRQVKGSRPPTGARACSRRRTAGSPRR